MIDNKIMEGLKVSEKSMLTRDEYFSFLKSSYALFRRHPQYLSGSENMDALELAHLIPGVPETLLAIYVGINDAVCNKGLVTPFLPRHAHNNVFAYDPQLWSGKDNVPSGTLDAGDIINGFRPPNESWDENWTYVMIEDPARSFESLWKERGYIDMIPAKFEDFTMLSDTTRTRLCTYIDQKAFEHPVNKSRSYLKHARERGEKMSPEFEVPEFMKGETDGLVPVVLNQGDYLFTLQNVINKRFEIEPGGKISFNGSPTSASVDMEAIYTTRAAPYNLYPDNDDKKEALKKRIPVECHLNLLGELSSPTLDMGIVMPTADAETRNLLENSTSTDEELMKQFLSLLVINNFYSVTGFGAQDLGTPSSIAGVTASELLSNQLSNWLSQISDDFDIGINYRPGDQVTRDEVEVALSTQLLNDRIIISGNVDVGGQETNPSVGDASNPYIVGDFDVQFRITDNVSVFAFNRARERPVSRFIRSEFLKSTGALRIRPIGPGRIRAARRQAAIASTTTQNRFCHRVARIGSVPVTRWISRATGT